MSVYRRDNFQGRVNLAALYIAEGRETTRAFDTCFEMYDGDAVATALYRRAQKAPDGDLARNLWRYLGRDCVEAVAIENERRSNLVQWSRELIERAEHQREAAWAKAFAEQAARNAAFNTELTPAGEQTVIPGCERNLSPKARQLDLFG